MDEQHLYGNHNLFNSASELEQKGADNGMATSVDPLPAHLHNFGAYPQQLPVIHENQAIFNAVIPTARWNSVFGWQFDHQIDYPVNYPFPLASLGERNTNNSSPIFSISDRDGSLVGNTENIDPSSIQLPYQSISTILQQEVYPKLQQIATAPHFQQLIQSIFGNHINIEKLHEIGNNWQIGEFSTLPLIEVREEFVFPTNTMGAFAGEIGKIYLSQELITHSESRKIADTILEEIGHWLDNQLNRHDTPGDEGQLLTAIITGQHLNNEQIAAIQTEDDSTTIFVDGQSLNVEQSTLPIITIAATDATARETITGQTTNPGRFTLTRIGNLAASQTINYTITGTATKGTDYTSLPGTVTFAAGASTATINVAPINDSISEPTETVTLNLAAGTGYSLGTAKTATVKITDNDIPVITIAATDATAGETVTGQTTNPGRFTLTRIGNLASSQTINYTITGTATKGTDYTSLPGTVTFAAGASTATINVAPINDSISEPTETVTLNLATGTGYSLGTAKTATVKIGDNDQSVETTDLIHFVNNESVVVWLSNGDGTFNAGQPYTPRSGYAMSANNYNFKTGDFNGDNKTDLIHFVNNESVVVWLSNGDGTFNAGQPYTPRSGYAMSANNYNFKTGDFNGDNKTDLIHFVNNESVVVWLSNGDGTFNAGQPYTPRSGYAMSANNYNFKTGDFNGDVNISTSYIKDIDFSFYITINSPNGSESLQAGSSLNITWTDNIAENVNIDLYKGGNFYVTLFSNTPSDGSENWILGNNLPAGSDYSIKITSINNGNVYDVSNRNFSIIASPPSSDPFTPLLTQQSAQYFKDRPQFYTTGNIFAQSMYGSSLINGTGYTEGNCTWYAHGRVKELGGSTAALNSMSGNANQWHNQLSNGATIVGINDVQVGDIAQWISGTAGHVAVVEKVYIDSSGAKRVVLSESHYSANYDGGGAGTLHRIVDYYASNPNRYIRVPKA
ncbi:Calx-beta domain-containing protein [Richelia sinica]|uniref:Calx-beta domain-containing protein n=1 Tax=Richelia sinica TaxID=1357545 RepID=UPI001682EDED|nr:Calx-beta domain-containing protein [Richelia sinica]MBD2663841.1 VCBS repeat-containing protein [Richelia sinica FACHB-800]